MEGIRSLPGSKKQMKWKRFVLCAGIVFLALGILIMDIPVMIIGIVLIYTSLYRKVLRIDEDGVHAHYNFLFYKQDVSYPFDQYQTILIDRQSQPEARFGFVKNGITTYAYFKDTHTDEIIETVKQASSHINIQHIKLRNRFS